MAIPTLKELRSLPTDELVERYDEQAGHVQAGVDFWLQELARRDADALARRVAANTDEMAQSGKRMERLTWVVAALTVVNVGVIVIDVW